ncbi:hypothetical protein ACFQ3W_12670 [Paenibacillus puldeungensis]|uniref:ABC transporter permease n=1 Tax=Paenibacillus puldeungensis TaxID=696536 RepID=A0ABW3RXB9_9BACL
MSKWLRQFSFELRLIFRNPWYMALPVLYGLMYAWVSREPEKQVDFYQNSYIFLSIVHTMTLGIVMLLGTLTIRRDIRRSSYEWNAALPVPYTTKISAKYIAGLLYFMMFTVLAGVIFAWSSSKTGVDASLTWENTRYYVINYEVSYMVTLALAMLLAISIPNRIVYLIAFCAWMFGTFFMDLFILDRFHLYFLRTFHLSQLYITSDMDLNTWGFRLIADEMMYSHLFVLAFAILLLAAGVLILNSLRPTRRKAATWMAGGLALLLAVGTFTPYGLIWQERYAKYHEKLRDPSIVKLDALEKHQIKDFKVTSYDINLAKESNDTLQIKVGMQVPTESIKGETKLPFTLNRAFRIDGITIDGVPAKYTRQGDELTVALADLTSASLRVQIDYNGKIMDYEPTAQGQGAFRAFVKDKNVYLPSKIAWYPMPGHRFVYVKEIDGKSLYPYSANQEWFFRYPSDIHLAVSGFDTPLYTSLNETGHAAGKQTFESKSSGAISLYAGTFTQLEHTGFPVGLVTTPYNARSGNELLTGLTEMYAYFDSWIEDFQPKVDQVLLLPMTNYLGTNMENQTYMMSWIEMNMDYTVQMIMHSALFGSDRNIWIKSTKEDVKPQIRSLIWYVYYREKKGLTDENWVEGASSNMLYDLSKTAEDDPGRLGPRMVKQVEKALDDGKIQQVKRVLSYFYSQGLDISEFPIVADSLKPITYEQWEQQWKKVMADE